MNESVAELVNDANPWAAKAACRLLPPEWWYGPGSVDASDTGRTGRPPKNPVPAADLPPTDAQKAIAICNTCPVKAECLATALARFEFGIWGGTTENERSAMQTQTRMRGPNRE